MDSRLMNAYHDDPYDPNYERYECNVTEVWSTDNIVMENMALTDTLNGILPMSATETDNETYCNIFFPDEHMFGDKESNNQNNKNSNMLIYNDFEQQHLNAEERVVTIETSNIINNGQIDVFDMIEEDRQSLVSLVSYRTRTDSSSIGDYESHSSDYDDTDDDDHYQHEIENQMPIGDDDDEEIDNDEDYDDDDDDDNIAFEELEADDLLTDLPGLNLLNTDQFMFTANGIKQRTMSTNTIGSDVDAANFDLADFITKDDDMLTKSIAIATKKSPHKKYKTPTKLKIEKVVDESDSDVIVDVETVEFEDNNKKRVISLKNSVVQILPDDNLEFIDNIKNDPEWNPKEVKLKTPSANKKICESSRGKGKNNTTTTTIQQQNNKLSPKKQILKSGQKILQKPQQQGLGRGGKNLALLKRDCESIEKKENTITPTTTTNIKTKGKDIALIKHDSNSIEAKKINSNQNQNNNNNNNNNNNSNINNNDKNFQVKSNGNETEKRKLNLEEYKRRIKGNSSKTSIITTTKINQIKPTTTTMTTQTQTSTTTAGKTLNTNLVATTTKPSLNPSPIKINKPHSEAVTSIVKTLKEQQQKQQTSNQQHQQQQQMDPITLAKNKVLRMQELKRQQQMKIIDSTISAKVPRVTKLLPLQEIIKDTAYAIKNDNDKDQDQILSNKKQTEYEKIVMVSVACNTILTFSPKDILPNVPLLDNKSRAAAENIKISHNSLITSIQDAIVKQNNQPKSNISISTKNNSKEIQNGAIDTQQQSEQQQQEIQQQEQHHGEDKIIMHLPKDHRIRHQQNKRCMDVQTDFQAAFPTLPLPKLLRKERQSRRRYRKHENNSNISTVSSCIDSSQSDHDDDDDNNDENGVVNNLNTNSIVTPVIDYPNSEIINGCGTSSIGGYSSRSSRRHRSSVSSSYSESGHQRSRDRQRRISYRKSMRKHKRSSSRSRSSSSESDLSVYESRNHSRRTRSRSPFYGDSNVRRDSSFGDRNVSKPAVEERRIVYVGRIEEETSKEMLRRKFIPYGSIRQITIHYKENGMKYGFVTFERSEDAFAVIDNSTRDTQINIYDISFGGRRAFCRTSYADLDNAGINNYQSYVFPTAVAPPKQEDSFEALLQKVKAKMNANKTTSASSSSSNNNNNKL